jgi:hypothetical protein
MDDMLKTSVRFIDADAALREQLGKEWGVWVVRYVRLEHGFSIVAMDGDTPVGVLAVA